MIPSRARRLALLAACIAVLLAPGQGARADSWAKVGQMHWESSIGSAIYDGTQIYVFGSEDFGLIHRYNPATNAAQRRYGVLLDVDCCTSAVWTGQGAYLFGGGSERDMYPRNTIQRYDPQTDTISRMGATLPARPAGVASGTWGHMATSAVWTGSVAYIFGGEGYPGGWNEIYRYDPATDTLTTMGARLPSGRWGTSAAWDGRYAYVFGGTRADAWSDGNLDEILRYDPVADSVTTLAARLPSRRSYTAAVWDGRDVYVLGGFTGAYDPYAASDNNATGQILRFDVGKQTVTYMSQSMSPGRAGFSAVWTGQRIYTTGGTYDENYCDGYGCMIFRHVLKDVGRYTLGPGNLGSLWAVPWTDSVGDVWLFWGAPGYDTYSPNSPLYYQVYRSVYLLEPERLLTETPGYTNEYHDTTCPLGFYCSYRVRAYNERGTTPFTNSAQAVGWAP